MKHNQMRQVVFPILAAFIWGTAFVAQDMCADSIGAFAFNASRYFIAVLALLVLDIRVLNGMAGGTAPGLLRVGVEILALLGIMVLQYLFPSLARFEASLADTLKNACMMVLAHLPKTPLMTAAAVGAVWITLINNTTIAVGLMVWPLIGFSLMAFGNSGILRKIFDNYVPKA